MVAPHTGNYTNDPVNGLRDEWRWNGANPPTDAAALSWLIGLYNNAYNAGVRDFILHMPAGVSQGSNYYGANHWFTIPERRRTEIKSSLGNWIRDRRALHAPDYFTFGIYISIPIRDDYDSSQLDLTEGSIHFPDPNNPQDIQWLKEQVDEWINIGIDRVWLDAAADDSPRAELGNKSLYAAALIEKEFYELNGIKTVAGEALPLQGYTLTGVGIPIPGSGNIHPVLSQSMPFMGTTDWMDVWDKKTQPFWFTYNWITRQCSVCDESGENFSLSYFTSQGYTSVESGDINNVYFRSGIFLRGKYYVDPSGLGPASLFLAINANQICQSLPTQDPNDVPTLRSNGIINHGRTTQYWTLPNGNEELCFLINYAACYEDSIITGMLNRGFRIGINEDSTILAQVMPLYNSWLSGKSVYRKIIRRHN